MSTLASRNRAATFARGKRVFWQRAPGATEAEDWSGNPCTGASTQDFASLITTKAKVHRKFFIWSFRRNALTNSNTRSNVTGSPLFRRTTALAFQGGIDYTVGEKILQAGSTYAYSFVAASLAGVARGSTTTITINSGHGLVDGDRVTMRDVGGATWLEGQTYYLAGVTATTARLQTAPGVELNSTGFAAWSTGGTARFVSTTYAADAAKWTLIGPTGVTQNECRVEYSTHANARNAVLARLAWALNRPQFDSGRGWGDYLGSMTSYAYATAMANRDTIFTNRPLDITSAGAVNYAVNTDIVLLTTEKITDAWVTWTPGQTYTRGTLVQMPGSRRFWWCATTHTASWADIEGSAPWLANWGEIEVWVMFDHEVGDDSPFLISDGAGSIEYLVTEARALCDTVGVKLAFYTNDLSSRRTTGTRNGFSETNINAVLGQVHCLLPICDGRNVEGSTLIGTATENYNRVAYVGGVQANGYRSNFSQEKYGAVIEMLDFGGTLGVPIASAVYSGNNIVVTAGVTTEVDVPPINTGEFVVISGTVSTNLRGTFKVSAVNNLTGVVTLSHRCTGVDPATGEPTLVALPAPLSDINPTGGLMLMGGNRLSDFFATVSFWEARNVIHFEAWLNFVSTELLLPGENSVRIAGMTNAKPVVITTATPHPFIVGNSAFGRATITGAAGFTNLNDATLQIIAVPSATQITLDGGYDGSQLPAWTGGGYVHVTRQRHTYERLCRVCFGWGA